MPDGWSRLLDAERMADQLSDIAFAIPLVSLPQLKLMMAMPEGTAEGSAKFSRERDFAAVDLSVSAEVPLICQRCMQPMRWPVSSQSRVALVGSDSAAARVPPEFEAVIAPQGRVTLADLVEQEILLTLPVVALHADGRECGIANAAEIDEFQKPFAGLEKLLESGS